MHETPIASVVLCEFLKPLNKTGCEGIAKSSGEQNSMAASVTIESSFRFYANTCILE